MRYILPRICCKGKIDILGSDVIHFDRLYQTFQLVVHLVARTFDDISACTNCKNRKSNEYDLQGGSYGSLARVEQDTFTSKSTGNTGSGGSVPRGLKNY